jgi:hypothetical protein
MKEWCEKSVKRYSDPWISTSILRERVLAGQQ